MKFFIFLNIFLYLNCVGAADDSNCLKATDGSPAGSDTKILKQFNNPTPNSFLYKYTHRNDLLNCPPVYSVDSNGSLVRQVNDGQFDITADCVKKGLLEKNAETRKEFICEKDSHNKIQHLPIKYGKTCVTQSMVDYVTWSMNEAFGCMNSILASDLDKNGKPKENPLPAELIAKQLFTESKFAFFISEKETGTGIGQVTTDAALGLMSPIAGSKSTHFQFFLDKMATSNNCQNFKSLFKNGIELSHDSEGHPALAICPMIEPNDGLAQNLFLSLAYFAYIRDQAADSIKATFEKNHLTQDPDDFQKNYFALIAYKYGPSQANERINALLARYGKKWFEVSDNTFIDKMRSLSKIGYPYINNIEGNFNALEYGVDKNGRPIDPPRHNTSCSAADKRIKLLSTKG